MEVISDQMWAITPWPPVSSPWSDISLICSSHGPSKIISGAFPSEDPRHSPLHSPSHACCTSQVICTCSVSHVSSGLSKECLAWKMIELPISNLVKSAHVKLLALLREARHLYVYPSIHPSIQYSSYVCFNLYTNGCKMGK